MLRVLPFDIISNDGHKRSYPRHDPETLGFVLELVPIDVLGQESHLAHPLSHPLAVSSAKVAFPVPDCARCAHLLQVARVQAQTNPALLKFASGKWHVSYDPISRHKWMAEARAVAQLIQSLQAIRTSDWLGFVDLVLPVLQPTDPWEEPSHVDWKKIHTAGVNLVPLPAGILGCVYERRFHDALGMTQQWVGEPSENEATGLLRVLDQIKRQGDMILTGLDEMEHEARNGQKELLRMATDLLRVVWSKLDNASGALGGEYVLGMGSACGGATR